jgi:hypothetical protein
LDCSRLRNSANRCIVNINGVVPLKQARWFISDQLHDYGLGHASFSHVGDESAAKIMEPKVGDPSLPGRQLKKLS